MMTRGNLFFLLQPGCDNNRGLLFFLSKRGEKKTEKKFKCILEDRKVDEEDRKVRIYGSKGLTSAKCRS